MQATTRMNLADIRREARHGNAYYLVPFIGSSATGSLHLRWKEFRAEVVAGWGGERQENPPRMPEMFLIVIGVWAPRMSHPFVRSVKWRCTHLNVCKFYLMRKELSLKMTIIEWGPAGGRRYGRNQNGSVFFYIWRCWVVSTWGLLYFT